MRGGFADRDRDGCGLDLVERGDDRSSGAGGAAVGDAEVGAEAFGAPGNARRLPGRTASATWRTAPAESWAVTSTPRTGVRRATVPARVSIPAAYELDDLTAGILWAIANLEDSLLADDAELAEARGFGRLQHASRLRRQPRRCRRVECRLAGVARVGLLRPAHPAPPAVTRPRNPVLYDVPLLTFT